MDSGVAPAGHGGVVLVPLHCRGCGYNLYGLPSGNRCPECGLDAWQSILHTVDPAASKLPVLDRPRAVGNALLWLIGCMAASALLPALRPAARWLDALDERGLRDFSSWLPGYLYAAAGVTAIAGLAAARRLSRALPANGSSRDGRLLAGGIGAWGLLLVAGSFVERAAPPWAISLVLIAAAAAGTTALLGLSGVLRLIGLRSREYRTARGSRQGIQAMVAAIAVIAAGHAARAAALAGGHQRLGQLASTASSIATVMVVIGLLYLLVNAGWIRHAIRCPPPRLDQVLGPGGT
jgi:hypothetical protein